MARESLLLLEDIMLWAETEKNPIIDHSVTDFTKIYFNRIYSDHLKRQMNVFFFLKKI